MAIPSAFTMLTGAWSGTNLLWLGPPGVLPDKSTTTLTSATTAQSKFLTLAYTWAHEGAPHEGLLVLGQSPEGGAIEASWVDSFHNGDKFMLLKGGLTDDGSIAVKGTYSVEGYEGTWGWQIALLPPTDASFTIKMDNIAPDGTHYPAVEAVYTRTR